MHLNAKYNFYYHILHIEFYCVAAAVIFWGGVGTKGLFDIFWYRSFIMLPKLISNLGLKAFFSFSHQTAGITIMGLWSQLHLTYLKVWRTFKIITCFWACQSCLLYSYFLRMKTFSPWKKTEAHKTQVTVEAWKPQSSSRGSTPIGPYRMVNPENMHADNNI